MALCGLLRMFSRVAKIPSIVDFMASQQKVLDLQYESPFYESLSISHLKFYVQTYGCQMNLNDSEIVISVLQKAGMEQVDQLEESDVVLINTCSIRQQAEDRVIQKLQELRANKITRNLTIGVLGCMAERLKHQLLEDKRLVDIVAGPDSYKTLPQMIHAIYNTETEQAINTQLSLDETYADITPIRKNEISAFISIMRGCNNMCSFCVVPFTRGRERSRDSQSIIEEAKLLRLQGVKQITLLGQNVNSYYQPANYGSQHQNTPGFKELFRLRGGKGIRFANLLESMAKSVPDVRLKFTSPHPKDFPSELIQVIKDYPNVVKTVHLPLQSGSNRILNKMRRFYTKEAYVELAQRIRDVIPNVTITTDIIAGFCGENDQDHQDTIDVLHQVKFEQAFMFQYSMRSKTYAYNNFEDDVPNEIKHQRLSEIIQIVKHYQLQQNQQDIGKTHTVLIDGLSKRNTEKLVGRSLNSKKVVLTGQGEIGDTVNVKIEDASANSLFGVLTL